MKVVIFGSHAREGALYAMEDSASHDCVEQPSNAMPWLPGILPLHAIGLRRLYVALLPPTR